LIHPSCYVNVIIIVFSAKWLRRENVKTDIFGGIQFGSLDGRKSQSAVISLIFTFLFENAKHINRI